MFENFKLFAKFYNRYWYISRSGLAILLISGAVTAILETVGMFLIWPMIGLFIDEHKGALSRYGQILEKFTNFSSENAIVVASVVLICVYSLKNLVMLFSSMFEVKKMSNWKIKLSNFFYERMLFAPYQFHSSKSSSDIIQFLNLSIPYVIDNYVDQLFKIFSNLLILMGIAGLVIFLVSPSTVFAVVVAACVTFALHKAIRRLAKRLGQQSLDDERDNYSILQQTFTAYREIHVYGVFEQFHKLFAANNKKMSESKKRLNLVEKLPGQVNEVLLISVLLIVMNIVSNHNTGLPPQERLQELGVLVLAFFRMVPTLNQIMTSTVMMNSAIVPLKHMLSYTDSLVKSSHFENYLAQRNGLTEGKVSLDKITGDISLQYISFSHYESEVLRDVSLTFKQGSWTTIVGPSGSGKTTLLNILMGFLTPSKGSVQIGNHNIQEDMFGWQRRIAAIFQEYYIMDTTIAENIAFGLNMTDINQAKVEEVVKMVMLDDVVAAMGQGIFSPVGENGKRLSGGQRQRLAIARALYFDKDIWILDEATSSLDLRAEAKVLEVLKSLDRPITVVMSAHRESVYDYSDSIICINNQSVAFEGTPHEYRKLQSTKKSEVR